MGKTGHIILAILSQQTPGRHLCIVLTGSDKCPTETSKLAAALSALASWISVASSPFSRRMIRYSLSSCCDFWIGFVNTENEGIVTSPELDGITRRQSVAVAIPQEGTSRVDAGW